MNDCKLLHETIVRDIYDVITSVKDIDEVEWLQKRNNVGSIARRASNLVLVFPVIVSTSINIQSAMMISKAIERKCCTLLQILFSSVQLTDAETVKDYISQFHNNIDFGDKMSLDSFMGIVDDMANEGAIEITDADAYAAVKEDMKNINYTLSNILNPISINDYSRQTNIYGESTIMLNEANPTGNDRHNRLNALVDKIASDSMNKMTPMINDTIRKASTTFKRNQASDNSLKDLTSYYSNQLLASDVRKANELVPTIMMVNFMHGKDGVKYNMSGVIGVKAKLYPVDSMEIISRLSSKVKDSNGLFNLIRATTREISFFKDLMFCIDKAKLDSVNMAKGSNNAKIFKLLERRANKNKFMRLIRKNNASPITSLVLSQEEVEYLKKYNNMDMDKAYNTRTILEAYNLMDIVIVDESMELAKFMYDDGDGMYETITFDSLEKEASDNSYKKVINLMSKMNR